MPLLSDRKAIHAAGPRCILLLVPLCASVPGGVAAQAIGCADRLVESFRAAHGIPGVAAAVLTDGVVAYNRAVGDAHVELGVPVTPSTAFRASPRAGPSRARSGIPTDAELLTTG